MTGSDRRRTLPGATIDPMATDGIWFGPRIDRRAFLALVGCAVAAGCSARPAGATRERHIRADGDCRARRRPGHRPTHSMPFDDSGPSSGRARITSRRLPRRRSRPATLRRSCHSSAITSPSCPGAQRSGDPLTEARWGARGTLASGRGTLRERADLLVELLGTMGVTGTVMSMPIDPRTSRSAVPSRCAFTPDLGALGALWDTVDAGHPRLTDGPDDAPTAAARAASAVLAALPPELRTAQTIAAGLPDRIPVVAFGDGADARWATAVGGTALLTTAPDGMVSASAAVMPQVTVSVQVAFNPPRGATVDRTVLHEVLRGTWPADQLAARHLTLAFGVPGSPLETLQRRRSEVPVRQPVLRLEAIDADDGTIQIVGGTAISLAGGLVTPASDGSGALDGPLGPILAAPPSGATVATVTTIAAAASIATFPTVDLAVSVRDVDGRPIDGLPASAFEVTDDGQPQTVTLIGNSAPTSIRILVIYDSSGSVTDFWPSATARAAFESRLATALTTAAAAHPFTTQVIGIGGAARDDAWAAPEAPSPRAAFAGRGRPSTSDIWTTLGRPCRPSGASAVILVSDNAASDFPEQIPGLRRQLRAAGAPIAVLPVGLVDKAATDAIVADTHGRRFDPEGERPRRATRRVRRRPGRDRRLDRLSAAVRGADRWPGVEGSSRVRIAGSTASPATLTYDVPAPADRSAPSGVAGVYLTVTVGDRVMRRRLGGVPASDRDVPSDTADATAIAEATAALDAIQTIRFEPGIDHRTAARRPDRGGADIRAARRGLDRGAGGHRRRVDRLASVPGPPRGDVRARARRQPAIDATPAGLAVSILTESVDRDGPGPPLRRRARPRRLARPTVRTGRPRSRPPRAGRSARASAKPCSSRRAPPISSTGSPSRRSRASRPSIRRP